MNDIHDNETAVPLVTLTGPDDLARLEAVWARDAVKAVALRFASGPPWSDDDRNLTDPSLAALALAPVPVLALLEGCCVPDVMAVALAASFRMAADNVEIVMPAVEPAWHARVWPGWTETLPWGATLDGAHALRLGLILETHGPDDLETGAMAYLKGLVASRSVRQIRAMVQAVNSGRTLDLDQALSEETRLFLKVAREQEEA